MREDIPSLTAIYVTFARALATRDRELAHACSDPFAERLLPRALTPLLDRAARTPWVSDAVRRLSFGMCDHVALRTALIDAALTHAVVDHREVKGRAPVEQVVLLGAGFDARAHRLSALAETVLFEVDHPATQKVKSKKARALPVLARELRYAPCDFEKTRISDALLQAGFDPNKRSTWIWEGVTMYLPATGVVDSLQTMARLSAPDSMLITTYITPDIVSGGRLLGEWSSAMLGIISEPLRFSRSPDELAELFGHAGFEVLSDASPQDAAAHFGVHVKRPTTLMPAERIAVAIKKEKQT
jgi:methyltransferase (TIGR00027 family)